MFDLASKYCFYLNKDGKKSMELFLLLSTLEKYVNGAIIETNRMEKTRKNISKRFSTLRQAGFSNKKNFQITYLSCDTHFFFICIDKCYKLINQLFVELNDTNIEKLRDQLDMVFDITTVRNHLEHIEDRCIGYLSVKDRKQNVKTNISDFGNFIGSDFSFNNKKFPSSKRSLEELKNIYKKLVKILHTDYASKDPKFIERMIQDKKNKLIQKDLKRLGFF